MADLGERLAQVSLFPPEPSKAVADMTEAEKIQYALESKGWVALEFPGWVQDTIILANDERVKTPAGHAVYTLKEFEMIIKHTDTTKNPYLVHAAKKMGAVITSIERLKN
ncbi:MAG: hypothetical protein JW967_01625 [Dehalococcoidales bacterium]|nr:hypothetical protein [Dehalococcoidales bacterium]